MGFWGWRQGAYAVFISVLVTACVPAQQTALAPTLTPIEVTLTVVKPPGLSPTPRAPHIQTATPMYQAVSLDVLPPHCDELVGGGLQCLGILRNPNTHAIGWIVIHAESDGLPPLSAALEQRLVPAGMDAPYRLLIESPAEQLTLSLDAVAVNTGWVTLEVTDERATITADGYYLTARLINPSSTMVKNGRVVVALFDGDVLVSYRVLDIDELAAGEGITLEMAWAGAEGVALHHTISAIAWQA